jgi:hypothetical protein
MAEKKVIELEIKSDSVGTLKSQLKAAQNEVNELSAKFGATSQEAVNAAKKAAQLKDAIADAKALTDSFNPDGKFNALSASIGGALNGFQAFEGAMGLVGVESEDLQKTLLKVQSAMALSQGVQGLLEAKDSFKQLGAVAADALKGIRTGIAATGIGLLVVAVGALVAYWDDIKEAISGVSAEQEALNVKTEENLKMSEEKVAALDKQDNILKLQGKTEKQILQFKIAELDTAIKIAEVNIENQKVTKAAQIEAAKRNKDILVGILDFLTSPINVLLKTIDKIASVVGIDSKLVKGFDAIKSAAANIVFDPAETAKEGDLLIKAAEERFIELKNQKAGYELQIQAIDKQAADARKQAQKEANDKRLADQKEAGDKDKEEAQRKLQEEKDRQKELYDLEVKSNEERLKLQEQQYDLSLSLLKNAREKEIQELVNSYDAKYEMANGNAELEKQLNEKLNSDIAAINKKYADEDARLKEEQKEKDKQAAQEAIELENQKRTKQLELATSAFSALGDLVGSFSAKNEKDAKKQFKIQKAFNLASAITNTALAITGALTAGGNPIKLATGAQFVEAALAAVTGAASIAKIAGTQFESASSGGGSGAPSQSSGADAGASNIVTPNFNIVGNAQATNPLAGLGGQPLQAYVVSGDVTTAQSLDRNRINYATFG